MIPRRFAERGDCRCDRLWRVSVLAPTIVAGCINWWFAVSRNASRMYRASCTSNRGRYDMLCVSMAKDFGETILAGCYQG